MRRLDPASAPPPFTAGPQGAALAPQSDVVERTSGLPAPVEAVAAWLRRPGAAERLLPPGGRISLVGQISDGAQDSRLTLEARRGLSKQRWVVLRRIESAGRDASRIVDRVQCPGTSAALSGGLARQRIERVLDFGHTMLRTDLEAHAPFAGQPRLRAVVTGASGLIGRSLVPFLTTGGHQVRRLVRRRQLPGDALWVHEQGRIDAAALNGVDAVVHLAGENVGARWSRQRRHRIWSSRAIGTRFLCETLARLHRPPRVLVSASAVGIYGDRGGERLTETSSLPPANASFLVDVCREWEAATEPARAAGIRVVNLRLGVVLTPQGGALARMLPIFRLGLGGRLGSGEQWMSWIGVDDAIGAIHHAITVDALYGPVNATSPQPVTNREFTATLARRLHRPAALSVPAPLLRAAFGEMAEVALLQGARVMPARLSESGFRFRHPALADALNFLLAGGAG